MFNLRGPIATMKVLVTSFLTLDAYKRQMIKEMNPGWNHCFHLAGIRK